MAGLDRATSCDSSASRGCARRACPSPDRRPCCPSWRHPTRRGTGCGDRTMARRREHAVVRGVAHRLLQAFSCSSGLTNGLTSSRRERLTRERRRLGREGLRGRRDFAGHLALRHGPLLDRPQRLAGQALEHVEESGLAGLRHDVDGAPVVADGQQLGRGREVVVPEIVVDGLEVPEPLARSRVEREQAVAEQVVAGAIAAVEIVRGRAGRHEDDGRAWRRA